MKAKKLKEKRDAYKAALNDPSKSVEVREKTALKFLNEALALKDLDQVIYLLSSPALRVRPPYALLHIPQDYFYSNTLESLNGFIPALEWVLTHGEKQMNFSKAIPALFKCAVTFAQSEAVGFYLEHYHHHLPTSFSAYNVEMVRRLGSNAHDRAHLISFCERLETPERYLELQEKTPTNMQELSQLVTFSADAYSIFKTKTERQILDTELQKEFDFLAELKSVSNPSESYADFTPLSERKAKKQKI